MAQISERHIYILKHAEDEGPGLLGDFLQHRGWESVTLEVYRGDKVPTSLDNAAAVVVLGGPMNVYEEDTYPFLKMEDDFIRRVLEAGVPFLGICLGAQLLAKACGARVMRARQKEIGWFEVSLTEEGQRDRLFRGLTRELAVFQWHEDTFAVPDGGTLLATGELCRNQAFKVGRTAYGLQFHPEVTPRMVHEWLEKERTNVDTDLIEREGALLRDRFETQADSLLRNFHGLVESSARASKER